MEKVKHTLTRIYNAIESIYPIKVYKRTSLFLGLLLTALFVSGQEGSPSEEMATQQDNFFTPDSLTTLSSAIAMVYVATNVLKLLNLIKPIYLSMILSFMIVAIGAISNGELANAVDYGLVFFNGCLLFTNAVGINEAANALKNPNFKAFNSSNKGWGGSWVS